MIARRLVLSTLVAAASGLIAYTAAQPVAEACGCLAPPVPEFDDSEFAVNQQSEQIIFEVEDDGYVTAHVLIKYAGRPESFAWLVPAPNVPDFEIGNDALFGALDGNTAPEVIVSQPSLCPDPEFVCERHNSPFCPMPSEQNASSNNGDSFSGAGNNAPDSDAGGMAPPVEVLKTEQVGDYLTIVFAADEAVLAIDWLNENGFIVNDTMSPYMQPYLDDGMVFVASKLVAGATTEQIKPLKMRYQATEPMIPLQLTAVAAEPHLTVTAYILHSGSYFQPTDQPVVAINPADISQDGAGRNNYPMVMARAIDEAGGDGFVIEYAGPVPQPTFDACCEGDFDNCFVAFDGLCQCPLSEFDTDDCGDQSDLIEGFSMLDDLRNGYSHLTRLTTRISPEEMTFDPMFEPIPAARNPELGRRRIEGKRRQMWGCADDVIDKELHDSVEALSDCASTYCGEGVCGVNAAGLAGCVCEPGYIARQFTDLDGAPSVTCVPRVGTVDLAAGGLTLPSACKPSTCGSGSCLDVGGFATCDCGSGSLAIADENNNVPSCGGLVNFAGDNGARDYTVPMEDVRACAPTPQACGEFGWLVENPNIDRQGVICPSSLPEPSTFDVPRAPTCEDYYPGYSDRYPGDPSVDSNFDGNPDAVEGKEVGGGCAGGGCSAAGGAHANGGLALLLLGLLRLRRRR